MHGNGTTSSINKYKFIDRSPISGIGYYKLVQYDYDNTSSSSNIIAVKFREAFNIGMGTNPVTDEIQLQVNTAKSTTLTVYIMNAQGEQLSEQVLPVMENSQKVTLTVSKLAAGSYLMKVTDTSGTSFWLRFVKI